MKEIEYGGQAVGDMVYLIACGIHDRIPEKSRLLLMDWERIHQISVFHGLNVLVYSVLELNSADALIGDRLSKIWREEKEKSVRKNILMDLERKRLLQYCEEQRIKYLLLKGSVIKELYPSAYMRQMADQDIWIDELAREKIREWFEIHGYEAKGYGSSVHDCYYKKPIYNFEIHIKLFDPERFSLWAEYYQDFDKRLMFQRGETCEYCFRDEDFYIYFLLHAYKHFQGGGTGIRTLLDCYLFLNKKADVMEWTYVCEELKKLGIDTFETKLRKLSSRMFSLDSLSTRILLTEREQSDFDYLVNSGLYGTKQHHIENELRDKNGKTLSRRKIRYIFNRLFPDRMFMERWCSVYDPRYSGVLKVLPVAWAIRIFIGMKAGRKKIWKELWFVCKYKTTKRPDA